MVTPISTVAITGASGYIGRHLVAELRRLGGMRIKVLSRGQQRQSGKSEFGSGVEVTEGDLHVPVSLHGFLEPGCTVVHLAYLQDGGESENLAATTTLLDACRLAKVGRLIHCSTAAVAGRVPDNLISEDTPCQPMSEYGRTKLKIEQVVLAAAGDCFDVVVLRPTAVFGAGGGSLQKLVGDLAAGKRLRNYLKSCLFNERRMNLVFVANVVAAIIFMARYQEKFDGGIFIISDDDNPQNNFADVERFLMHQLAIKRYFLPIFPVPLVFLSFLLKLMKRNDTNPCCNYDSHKLLDLGFRRPVEFEAGLKTYADWYRSEIR
ncbi:MAG: NAD-dependent epimerase/dehydratase family protein [Betaproteobacteria bacterium]